MHVAEWRALLDALQTDERWAAGPFGWWGVSMGTTHGLPLAAEDDRIAAAVFGLNALARATSGGRAQAGGGDDPGAVPQPVGRRAHDPRDLRSPCGRPSGSTEKTMHVNPGGHVQVPRFERDASEDFFRRHLLGRSRHAAFRP